MLPKVETSELSGDKQQRKAEVGADETLNANNFEAKIEYEEMKNNTNPQV